MKTPEEIKRGLELCSHEGHGEEIICEHCPYDSNSCAVLICTRRLSADALAYIQQLETENHQLLTKAQQLESTISQVSKALCGKEKAPLKELLQAADQLKTRALRWISVEERLPEPGRYLVITQKDNGTAKVNTATYNDMGWWTYANFGDITHWMPMPEPQKEDDHAVD